MLEHRSIDSFKVRAELQVGSSRFSYYSLKRLEASKGGEIQRLPYSLKVLLENLLRHEDGSAVKAADIDAFYGWLKERRSHQEIAYHPARVLMQDFTGVPAMVDLAAMRQALEELGGDPANINPLCPVDLVIDHSVMVDTFGTKQAFERNVELEFERNGERYTFLKWCQKAFRNFRVVPPGTGICHQVNLENLAEVIWRDRDSDLVYPDTLVGTDSHTTMVNGLAVLGWGVGGIEAEAAMLGQAVSMVIPEVIGFKITGGPREGVTATDIVLSVTEMLRKKGVVGKFVEFYGPGLDALPLADRATIANMAPEYGATCGFFPIDHRTIEYLRLSGRDDAQIALVEAYAKEQGMWRSSDAPEPIFTDTLSLDLGTVEPSVAGPKRPQDRITLPNVAKHFCGDLTTAFKAKPETKVKVEGAGYELEHGAVVIAAITSCTNTSNPSVMLAAGLVARNAVKRGLKIKPWVKTSLAPGSQVVTDYLVESRLQEDLDKLGFNLVGYGCTTCIGNSGPLDKEISAAVQKGDLVAASVLSGNRNFEGRINPDVKANYLMSPPLVVAYALAGSVTIDLTREPLGTGSDGKPVYLADIWPSSEEVARTVAETLSPAMFKKRYADVFQGPREWQALAIPQSPVYQWSDTSTYIRRPTFFDGLKTRARGGQSDITGARALAILGDSITTDHISPAGSIKTDSPAGLYLRSHGVEPRDFNSYGSRRGNHEVMMRGTFANIRIRNEMAPGTEGGVTRHVPSGQVMSIYDAAMKYEAAHTPLMIFAGKEYGTGSSRDWAAKGTFLLGVKAVVAESFERIHRSNLVGMGVLPLEFPAGTTRTTLKLDGSETFDLVGLAAGLTPRGKLRLDIHRAKGGRESVELTVRIDTAEELSYYRSGGILQYVLLRLSGAS